jgi:D-alanyl-lipoteichoic acid acyltransferase DltB (MBOAT superfamily)
MLFNSLDFFVFLPVVLALYYPLGRLSRGFRLQNVLLLIASYYFYARWDWRFLSLIWISTVIDFLIGGAIPVAKTERGRKFLLLISTVSNLGLLGVFKYYDFFIDSFVALMHSLDVPVDVPTLRVILPVGISFYTFQTMSYTIDVYRRELEPSRDLLDFSLFVAFFPQLVAGPIERARALLPQIASPRHFSAEQFREGVYLMLWGLYKKVYIADVLAGQVNPLFATGQGYSGLDVWLGLYLFAFQIYTDFSGYTDIARGVSKMMGFELMVNFNIPYIATNPSDFWKRWHISLSSWLREYLYFSLGGNRKGPSKTYRNLMLTMLLGGLWHGAAWTFVIWGAFHGGILIIHHFYRDCVPGKEWVGWGPRRFLAVVVMFHVTCIGWLIFRAQSVGQIGDFLSRMFSSLSLTAYSGEMFHVLISSIWLLIVVQIVQIRKRDLLAMRHVHWFIKLNFYLFVIFGILEKFGAGAREFIYFQF